MRDEELFRAYWKNYILNQYPFENKYPEVVKQYFDLKFEDIKKY